jgi:hypothetical protein
LNEQSPRQLIEAKDTVETHKTRIPADFPLGGSISVVETHARHGGKLGTVRRHTAKYVVVTFEDDASNDREIRMSPNFLRRPDGESSWIERTPREAPRASNPSDADARCDGGTSPPAVGFKRAATVKFDLGRNSIAEYDKENPPNIVEHLPSDSPNIVEHLPGEIDDVTLRNEEILAEWDEHFDGGSRRAGAAARRRRAGMWPGTEPNLDERYNNLFFRLVSL